MSKSAPSFEEMITSDVALKMKAAAHITVEVDLVMALSVVGNLQLASRHPDNESFTAGLARGFARSLATRLVELVPELKEMVEAGWSPEVRDQTSEVSPIMALVAEAGEVFEVSSEARGGSHIPVYLVAIDSLNSEMTLLMLPRGLFPPETRLGDELLVRFDRRVCRKCGCSTSVPCALGCEWVEVDLCSMCAPPVILDAAGNPV
jgi:hypothetical protein